MGLLDNLINSVTSGEIDKKLLAVADGVEKLSDRLDGSAKQVVQKSEAVGQTTDTAAHTVAIKDASEKERVE